jgi:hypothetical protein
MFKTKFLHLEETSDLEIWNLILRTRMLCSQPECSTSLDNGHCLTVVRSMSNADVQYVYDAAEKHYTKLDQRQQMYQYQGNSVFHSHMLHSTAVNGNRGVVNWACRRCHYGPIELGGCDNLSTHQGELTVDGVSRIDNRCPNPACKVLLQEKNLHLMKWGQYEMEQSMPIMYWPGMPESAPDGDDSGLGEYTDDGGAFNRSTGRGRRAIKRSRRDNVDASSVRGRTSSPLNQDDEDASDRKRGRPFNLLGFNRFMANLFTDYPAIQSLLLTDRTHIKRRVQMCYRRSRGVRSVSMSESHMCLACDQWQFLTRKIFDEIRKFSIGEQNMVRTRNAIKTECASFDNGWNFDTLFNVKDWDRYTVTAVSGAEFDRQTRMMHDFFDAMYFEGYGSSFANMAGVSDEVASTASRRLRSSSLLVESAGAFEYIDSTEQSVQTTVRAGGGGGSSGQQLVTHENRMRPRNTNVPRSDYLVTLRRQRPFESRSNFTDGSSPSLHVFRHTQAPGYINVARESAVYYINFIPYEYAADFNRLEMQPKGYYVFVQNGKFGDGWYLRIVFSK